MKYLITLIVCALLTVGLIFSVEILQQIRPAPEPWSGPHWTEGVWFVAIMVLPFIILAATIWSVIGFTKTVNRWVAENQGNDCPPVMHSRHSKDAEQMCKEYHRALMYGAGPKTALNAAQLNSARMRRAWDLSMGQHGGTEDQLRAMFVKSGLHVLCLKCKGKGSRIVEYDEHCASGECDDCGGTGTVVATDDEFTILIDQEYGYTYFKWIIKGYEQLEIEFLVDAVIKDPNYCWCGGPSGNDLAFAGEWTEIDYEEYVRLFDANQFDAGGHFHTTDDSHFSFKSE